MATWKMESLLDLGRAAPLETVVEVSGPKRLELRSRSRKELALGESGEDAEGPARVGGETLRGALRDQSGNTDEGCLHHRQRLEVSCSGQTS